MSAIQSHRPCRATSRGLFAGALAVCALLSGCATAPAGVNRVLGQIPGVSLMVDADEMKGLTRRSENDDISAAELQAIESRPLPAPPGVSFEVAAVRRILASLLRGNNQGVIDTHDLIRRHGRTPDILATAIGAAAVAEMQRGNLQTALKYGRELEQRWYADVRDNRNAPSSDFSNLFLSFVSQHVSLAIDAVQPELADRLLREYVEKPGGFPKASEFQRHIARITGIRMRAELASFQGKHDTSYRLVVDALASHKTTLAKLSGLSEVDTRTGVQTEADLLYNLVDHSINTGDLANARIHVEALRQLLAKNQGWKAIQKTLGRAETLFFIAIGDYSNALRAHQTAMSSELLFERTSAHLQTRNATFSSPLLFLAGSRTEALSVLLSRGPLDGIQDSSEKDALLQWLAFVGAHNDKFDDYLSRLDRLDSRYAKFGPGKATLMHYGAKTSAYERRGTLRTQPQDYQRAVENGRRFSSSMRQVRASAASREAAYMPPLLNMVKESYLRAAAASLGRGGVTLADLLDALTLLQTSETDDDIAAAASRQKQIPGVSAAQLRQLQDLQQAARGAQRMVTDLSRSADADPARMTALTTEANASNERLAKHLNELQRNAPALAQAFGGAVPSVGDIQSRLGAQDGLVSFAPVGEQTFALLVTKSGVEHRMLALSPDETKALVKRVRDSVTFNDAVQAPAFDVAASKALHDKLFGWAPRSFAAVKSLTVVTSGALGSIPFSLLLEPTVAGTDYRSMPWLIKSMAITHMPSIASWYAVSGNSAPVRSGSFIAWADPDFTGEAAGVASSTRAVRKAVRAAEQRGLEVRPGQLPANLGAMLPALPETKAEAQAVARALRASSQTDVVAGSRATRSSVMASSESGLLAQKGVVMFATHGLAPAQVPGLFQPALAMAREPGSTQPSLLQLDDVVGLRMNADWVLLSACNTASADRAGGDSISGLARGFFFAGARSLLVTHWEVESESAAAITTKTMERYAANTRLTRAQALQETAIELIDAKRTPQEWAHPAFWAAYALIGDGRRGTTGR